MKIALVTGANKGMGFEVVRQLAKQGNRVILGARDKEKGLLATSKLKEEGLEVEFVLLDLGSEASIKLAAKFVHDKFGKLDILINNAGVNPEYPKKIFTIEQLPTALIKSIFDSNFFGALITIREFLPLLRKAEKGRIVNVSSIVGSLKEQSIPIPIDSPFYGINTLAYATSKTALNSLTVQVAKQVAYTNIKINAVCPGWVKTDMGSENAPRTIEQGISIILKLASIDETGPNGGFFNEEGAISW